MLCKSILKYLFKYKLSNGSVLVSLKHLITCSPSRLIDKNRIILNKCFLEMRRHLKNILRDCVTRPLYTHLILIYNNKYSPLLLSASKFEYCLSI